MTILRENEAPLLDTRYLRKDAGATDQTIAGTGTLTISSYSISWTAGNLTMSAGTASITNATTGTTLTAINTNAPAGGLAASFQRTNGANVIQVGNNVALTNWIVTSAGATTQASTLTVSAGGASITNAAGIAVVGTGTGQVAGSFQRTTAGTAFQVGDNATLTNFTVTAAGAFTASAASTIALGASGTSLTTTGTSGQTRVVLTDSGNNNGNITLDPGFASGIAAITSGSTFHMRSTSSIVFVPNSASSIALTLSASSSTITCASGIASGANTGFTFNATNGPNILADFQSAGATALFRMDVANRFFWVNGNNGAQSPGFGLALNSVTTAGVQFNIIQNAGQIFAGTAQSDCAIIVVNTAKSVHIGPGNGSTFAPMVVSAGYSGNNLVSATWQTGQVPSSVAGNGTAAVNTTILGVVGGASSGVTGQTGGTGSTWTITAGAGGAVAGASGIGGAGGGFTVTCGAGGNGAATGGAGGSVSITAGNAGTGGNANGGNVTLTAGTLTGAGTAGVIKIVVSSNSTSAVQIQGASSTTFATFDSSNSRLRIGDSTAPTATLDVAGNFTVAGATGNTVIGSSGPTLSKAATSAALSVRNATATLADLNLNVLTADPGTLQDGDVWIKNTGGVRTLNLRISGATYSATFV